MDWSENLNKPVASQVVVYPAVTGDFRVRVGLLTPA
jgi:hypothetical protein